VAIPLSPFLDWDRDENRTFFSDYKLDMIKKNFEKNKGQNQFFKKNWIISHLVGEMALLPRESGPGSSSGPKQGTDPSLYLLRDSNPSPNKIPHSPASLCGMNGFFINPNLSRRF
jgi:hypothetical protein